MPVFGTVADKQPYTRQSKIDKALVPTNWSFPTFFWSVEFPMTERPPQLRAMRRFMTRAGSSWTKHEMKHGSTNARRL